MSELQELAVFFVEYDFNINPLPIGALLQEKKRTFKGLLGELINDAYEQLPSHIKRTNTFGDLSAPDGVEVSYLFGDEEKYVPKGGIRRRALTKVDGPFLCLRTYCADGAPYNEYEKLEVAWPGRIVIGTDHEHSGCFKGGTHHEKELAWKAAQELAGYVSQALISQRLDHTLHFYDFVDEMLSGVAKYSKK